MKSFVLVVVLIVFCPGLVTAQDRGKISRLCASLQEKVIQPQKPMRFVHEYKFVGSCTFDYAFDAIGEVRFGIHRFRSRDEASFEQEALARRLTEADNQEPKRYKYQNIDPERFWDSSVAYEDKTGANHFFIVRQGKYLVAVYGADFSVLRKTESLLRDINFE